MNYDKAAHIIRQIAKEHHKTPHQVRQDMLYAAGEAMRSAEPHAKAVWDILAPNGVLPSAEELIHRLAVYYFITASTASPERLQ
jgi:hypothetical protein